MVPGDPKEPDEEVDGDSAVATEQEQQLVRPRQYRVLLHNDDYTTMEFVVMVLVTVFFKSEPEAVQIMLNVHRKGVGLAGIYSYEVAESKVDKVHKLAREQDYPLRASLEPE